MLQRSEGGFLNRVGNFFRNWPIASKLAVLAGALVMALVLALTYLTVRREELNFRNELEGQATLLLDTLPLTMRDQLYRLELDELSDIAGIVAANEMVTLFMVYDKHGAVLVDAASSNPEFSQEADPLGVLLLQGGPDVIYLDWHAKQLVAGRAIALGNQNIGAVALALSTASLERKVAALTQQSLWLAAVILVIGVAFAFVMAHQITNPLGELTVIAARMADGDLNTRALPRSTDEVGRLGIAFNRMVAAVQKRDLELHDFAADLERTVASRTAELQEQNTALAQTNAALVVARKQAEAANRAKSGLISMVSHELRTPLTSILGFAKLIKRRLSRVTCERKEAEFSRVIEQISNSVNIIVSEGDRLMVLINDVLDLARIESGKAVWHMQPLAVEQVITQSVTVTAALFEAKKLDLLLDVAPDLPQVQGDYDRLIQVFVNLISNAVKFTEVGSVTCRARLANSQSVAGRREIVLSVQDTGVGIDPQNYEKVFEQFVQVGAVSLMEVQGTGLGLPICKEIVEYHDGRIWVESELGKGSTFYFTLPEYTTTITA